MRLVALAFLIASQFGVGCDCQGPLSRPKVTIESPAEGARINAAMADGFEVAGTCSDVGEPVVLTGDASLTVRCGTDGWRASLNITAVPDGVVTVRANHLAAVGRAADEAVRAFEKDATAPTVRITAPGAGTFVTVLNQSAFELSGSCSEPNALVTISGAATATAACTSGGWSAPVDLAAVANGPLTLTANLSDGFGNAATPDSRTFEKRSDLPAVTLDSPDAGTFINLASRASFSIAGQCTADGEPVTVGVTHTGGDAGVIGDFACLAAAWSGSLLLSSVPDGPVTVYARHSNAMGLAAPEALRDYVKDTVAPAVASFSITTASPTGSTTISLGYGALTDSFSSVCILENNNNVSGCASAWVPATTLPTTFTLSGAVGSRQLTLWLRDAAGNESAGMTSNPVVYDTGAPVVTLQSPNGGELLRGGTMHTIQWSSAATDLAVLPIRLEYQVGAAGPWLPIATMLANSGSYNWSVPSVDSVDVRVRVTATDTASNTGSAMSAAPFTIDSLPPVFTAARMTLNAGATNTSNNFIVVTFEAVETGAPVTGYCLKYAVTATPSATDPCWVPVTPTATLSPVANFRLGFLPGAYTVYAWARNSVGLISGLTASGAGTVGTDRQSITYTPVAPPVLTGVTASSSNATVNLAAPSGNTVFIKWNASSVAGLATNPISIFYTTDDSTYTQVVAAVPNAQGAGCSISGAQTGCYTWANGAPTNGYFRVRVGAVDASARRTFRSTQPMNVGTVLNVLAGTQDPGTGGSAESAVFITPNQGNSYSDMQSFAVSPSGVVYFIDTLRGLLKIDPADGVQQLLVPRTGVTNDGAVPGVATLRDPSQIVIDPQGRLVIFDYNRLRRLDPVAQTLTTIVGGGTGAVPTSALNLQMTSRSSVSTHRFMYVTSTGKIYFQPVNYLSTTIAAGNGPYLYDPAAAPGQEVTRIALSGLGDNASPTQDISLCEVFSMGASFDAVTGLPVRYVVQLERGAPGCAGTVATTTVVDGTSRQPLPPFPVTVNYAAGFNVGGDGALYVFSRLNRTIERFDNATHTFVTVVGSGASGVCPDGTPALSCAIDPSDVFVDRVGQLYFFERGRIRAVDASGGVYTVMGTSLSAGDGAEALSARVGAVSSFKVWNGGSGDQVVFFDASDYKIREFAIGGNIQTVAGNGSHGYADTAQPANVQPLSYNNSGRIDDPLIQVDRNNGTIYSSARDNTFLSKIDRITGRWVDIVGRNSGGTPYYQNGANGLTGPNINFAGYASSLLAFDGTRFLAHKIRYNNGGFDSFFKLYTASNGTQSAMAGLAGATSGAGNMFAANGVAGTSSAVPEDFTPYMEGTWDGFSSRWVFNNPYNPGPIRSLPSTGGTLGTVASLPRAPVNFAYRHDASNNVIYYCDEATRVLYRFNVSNSSNTAYPWPIAKMRCTGYSLIYSSARNSLLFSFQQDGIGGIAEYLNP